VPSAVTLTEANQSEAVTIVLLVVSFPLLCTKRKRPSDVRHSQGERVLRRPGRTSSADAFYGRDVMICVKPS
jgi:hypothetical protein